MAGTKQNRNPIYSGYRVGKLTVEEATPQRRGGYTVWRCRCDCGGSILLDTRYLQRGTVTDCGCVPRNVKPGQRDLTGMRFGKLVCIEPTQERSRSGGIVWRCRCDCGNECLSVNSQLIQGLKKSCGCIKKPPLKDFVGKRFGMLTVLGYAGKWDKMHRWKCRCDCGKETIVAQSRLQNGHTKSCGCKGHPPREDLTGKVFDRLTVVERENKVNYWRCLCSCGEETSVRYDNLVSGQTKSCGCLQKAQIKKNLKLVDGTSVTKIESNREKLLANNTSGYNGVYRNRRTGKWIAQITFKGKTYYLGSYDEIGSAVSARRTGEQMYDDFLSWYYSEYARQLRCEKLPDFTPQSCPL